MLKHFNFKFSTFNFSNFNFSNLFNYLQENYLMRERIIIESKKEICVYVNGKVLINFCSNDYLNISQHPHVKKTFAESANQHGLGSASSALVSGYNKSHLLLEETFAEFLKRDRALLFNSGYHANLGVMTAFANRKTILIADKFCHASLNDGAVLSSAKYFRYKHQDTQQAADLLKLYSSHNLLLLTESVFSMQGSIADIKKLSSLALKHNALFVVDDAHGIGVLGKNGLGISEHFQLSQQEIPCLITTLGKAFGSFGAIVSGKNEMIETLLQLANTYKFSTALPPAICDATRAALTIIQNENWRREKLNYLCQFFIKEAHARELKLASTDVTPIKSILISSNKIAVALQKILMTKGLLVSCIRPPSVPKHLTCIRISLQCMHEEQQIIYLLNQLKEQYELLQRQ